LELKKITLSLLVLSMVVVLTSFEVPAQVANCDQLAGSPLDIEKTSPGVSYDKLNGPLAIVACRQALDQYPNSGRLWFQYGRALEKGNRLPDAIVAYQEAGKLNHAAALNNLGELYRDGKGFQKDMNKAEDYFKRSAALNSPEGRDNLLGLRKSMNAAAKNNTVTSDGFQMPSGNVFCQMEGNSLRCDLMSVTNNNPVGWTNANIPISKANCPVDWGGAFNISSVGKAAVLCHGDTVANPSLPKLVYGSTWTRNNIVCESQTTGLTCRNGAGHGFLLSKSIQQIF
jgi:hypothetical protein